MKSPAERRHDWLLAACMALALCAIGLGAFTRLVDAGLGCPDWPGCYGHLLWPVEASEIAAANALYPAFPVESHKTWPEMVHRYAAGTLGVAVLLSAWLAWRLGRPWGLPLGLLCLVVVQGAFGMWTVTLKLWPQVVVAHLLGGYAVFALLALHAQRHLASGAWSLRISPPMPPRVRLAAGLALAAALIQVALGGWMTANYAALACPDLPLCRGRWWLGDGEAFARAFDFLQRIGPNYLGGNLDNEARAVIHVSHRIGALVTAALAAWAAVELWRVASPLAKRYAWALAALLATQMALGVANVALSLPLAVAVAHNLCGCLLVAGLVCANVAARGRAA